MPSVLIEHATERHDCSCSVTYLSMAQLNQFHLFDLPNLFQSLIQYNYFQSFDPA